MTDNFSKLANFWLAVIFIAFVLAFDFCLYFFDIPPSNRDVIMTLIGTLNSGGVIMILNYFYGSTTSSKVKDDTISTLAKPPLIQPVIIKTDNTQSPSDESPQ